MKSNNKVYSKTSVQPDSITLRLCDKDKYNWHVKGM